MKKSKFIARFVFVVLCFFIAASAANAETLTVTNGNDEGSGSLREAIISAIPGDITILFDKDMVIKLETQLIFAEEGVTSLTIDGQGHDIVIDGSKITYPVSIHNAALCIDNINITIKNITFTGAAYGGTKSALQIENRNSSNKLTATIENCAFVSNGGGMNFTAGSNSSMDVFIKNTTVADNKGPDGQYDGIAGIRMTSNISSLITATLENITAINNLNDMQPPHQPNNIDVYINSYLGPIIFTVKNSLIGKLVIANGAQGTNTSLGYNIIENLINGFTPLGTDLIGTSISFVIGDAVKDKNNYIKYYALKNDKANPAIDVIPAANLSVAADQIGTARPQNYLGVNNYADIGAIEMKIPNPNVITPAGVKPNIPGLHGGVHTYLPTFLKVTGDMSAIINSLTGTLAPYIANDGQYLWLNAEGTKKVADTVTDHTISGDLLSMPIFRTEITNGDTAAFGFAISTAQLTKGASMKASDVVVIKARKSSNALLFTRSQNPATLTDGEFMIMNAPMTRVLQAEDALTESAYVLVLVIKDGSPYDLTGAQNGVVADPALIGAGTFKPSIFPSVKPFTAADLRLRIGALLAQMPSGAQAADALPFVDVLPDDAKTNLGCLNDKGYVQSADDGTFRIPPSTMAKLAATSVPPIELSSNEIVSMPIFKATVTADNVAIMGFEITGADFKASTAGKINLMKAQSNGNVIRYQFTADATAMTDGHFMAATQGGAALGASSAINATEKYILIMAIKDNGPYDLDPAKGAILDPASIPQSATNIEPTGTAGGAGGGMGGCRSFGLISIGLIFILTPMWVRRYGK